MFQNGRSTFLCISEKIFLQCLICKLNGSILKDGNLGLSNETAWLLLIFIIKCPAPLEF